MRKLFTFVLAYMFAFLAFAQNPQTITRSFALDKGTFTMSNSGKTYHAQWKSNATTPQLVITDEGKANNMWHDNNKDKQGEVHFFHRKWYISVEDGFAIKSYSFKFRGFEGANSNGGRKEVTVTPEGGQAVVCKADQEFAEVKKDNINKLQTSFTVANDNMVPSDFEVVIVKTKSAIERIETTTVVDGDFAKNTTWYDMRLKQSFVVANTGVNKPLELKSKTQKNIDDNLWAFVGDNKKGFNIYNRAAGVDYLLVSPKDMGDNAGGEAFVKLMKASELDESQYESRWKISVSNSIVNEVGFYFEQFGTNYAANERDGKLAFWTGGRDAGSTFTVDKAMMTYEVKPSLGTLENAPNKPSKWMAKWTSKATPSLCLYNANNNMQVVSGTETFLLSGNTDPNWTLKAPKGYVILNYAFTVTTKDGDSRVTPIVGGEAVTATVGKPAHVIANNVMTQSTTFTVEQLGGKTKIPVVSDFVVTILKYEEPITIVFDNSGTVPYRIPGITETKDGNLIAVADYRYCKADIGSGAIDLRYSISKDHGLTWSDVKDIVKSDPSKASGNQWDYSFGDPSIVADRESDEVLVMCVGGHVGYFSSTRENPQHVVRIRSHNGGKTWEKPEKVTEDIYGLYDVRKSGKPAGIFLTSGRIMQSKYIKVGKYYRLYIAHPLRGNTDGAYVIYSDDFGETWHVLGDVNRVPCTGKDESKVEELPDGSVLLSTRVQWGGRMYNTFTYTDPEKAEGVWGKEVMPDPMKTGLVNNCNGAVLVVPAIRKADNKKVFLTLQSVPMSNKRENVGFFYKEIDGFKDFETAQALGAGWKRGLQVSNSTSCYSSMVCMKNDTVAFLYEENNNNSGYDIVYKSLSVDTITKGEYTIDPEGGDRTPYLNGRNYSGKFISTYKPWFDTAGKYFSISNKGKEALQSDYDKFSNQCTLKQYLDFADQLKAYVQYPKDGYYRIRQELPQDIIGYPVKDHYMGSLTGKMCGLDIASYAQSPATVVRMEYTGDETFKLAIQGGYVSTAAHAKETAPARVVENGGVFEVHQKKGPGLVAFYSTEPNHESNRDCLHLAQHSYDMVAWTDAADASQWMIEDAKSVAVDLNEYDNKYYATFFVPFAVKLPEGVKAYTGQIKSGKMQMKEIEEGIIPASTAVLLEGSEAKAILAIVESDAAAMQSDLNGSYLEHNYNASTERILGSKENTLGLYRWNQKKLAPNHAYYKVSDAATDVVVMQFGEETSIAAIEDPVNLHVFDLQGRKVKQMHKGNIYIVNGKKVVL